MKHNCRKKIRILFLVSTLARKGPVFQLYNLLKYLDRSQFSPVILTLSPEPSDSLLSSFRKLDVPCYSLALSRLAGTMVAVPVLRDFLRDHPVDIIHTSGCRADLFSALFLAGTPRLITRRPTLFEYSLMKHGRFLGSLIDGIVLFGLRRVECVICVTNNMRQKMQSEYQVACQVIHNGVDEDIFNLVSEAKRKEIRGNLRLPQDVLIFIAVGQIVRLKDPLTVVRSFLASSVTERSMLILIGDGHLKGECVALSAGQSNVRMVGRLNNVVEYLQAADVFISASLTEGCPNAVLEALACGMPVLLSDIGPHREILAFDPMAGKLFPVKDVSALARTLDELMGANLESMRTAALNIIHLHLNAHRMSAQYQDLYIDCYRKHKNS